MKFFLTCLKWSLKIGGPILIWAMASDFVMSFLPAAAWPIFAVASPLVGVVMCFVLSFMIPSMRGYPMAAFGALAGYYAGHAIWTTWKWADAQSEVGVPTSSLLTADVLVGLTVCFGTLIGGAIGFVWAFPPLARAAREMGFALWLGGVHAGKTRRTDSNFYGSSDLLGKDAVRRLYDAGPGIVVGQFGEGPKALLVTYPLEGHFFVAAPTGTGKGTSVINLNLLTPGKNAWPGPVVVLDPQGESVFIAGRHREALGRKQIVFDPFEVIATKAGGDPTAFTPTPMRCNPLDPKYIRRDAYIVPDIEWLMKGLIPIPPNSKEKHFYESARRLVGGVLAYVLTTMDPEYHTLLFVYRMISRKHEDVEKMLEQMVADVNAAYGWASSSAAMVMNIGANERGSVYSTATNALRWLDTPMLRDQVSVITGATDHEGNSVNFDLEEVLQNKADLYIVCPPANLDIANTWVRQWFTLLMGLAQRKGTVERVLMIVDEAPLVGRMEPIMEAFRVARKNGLSVMLITQTLPDLIEAYGKTEVESLIRNAEAAMFFGISAQDDTLPEMIEKLSGTATYEVESDNDSEGASGKATDLLSNHSQNAGSSRKLEKRAVLLASDVRQMKSNEVVFINRGTHAKGIMVLRQAHYFARSEAKDRAGKNPYFRGKSGTDTVSGATKKAA